MEHISKIPACFFLINPQQGELETFLSKFPETTFVSKKETTYYFNAEFGAISEVIMYCDQNNIEIQLRGSI
jgi:hypothetical protein